jgi:hypothetical protein
MKTCLAGLTLAAMYLTFSSPADAGIITFATNLSGLNEVPPNGSTATGNAIVIVDDIANTVSVDVTFSGLIGGPATAAHIHCCVPAGVNAPVVIPFTGFPAATSGTYSNFFTGIAPATIAGLEAFQGYVNIHNATFPGGEIRGQLVPEPGAAGLLAIGLGLLGFARWRRR